ncbi:helix-turn-helix domain-containing protein [Coprobacter tertius]|uniref:Helix-turn-helix domain-containing protein n=1 Tax=Coprobacter tertius TaxID=2944915 RepID=A0ABT1MK70_9BACT|nr:helix-turn-helix domain-containing protein [Coprobacter tertius]MCP9613037.1 helix-turn-helix domain-containing protein [Coprobacter tertius]
MAIIYPHIDLPEQFIAWTDISEDILNLYKQSCKLKAGIFALCIDGSIKASINLIDYKIKAGNLISLLPGSIIQLNQAEENAKLCFMGFSSECIENVNLLKSTMDFLPIITENPVIQLNTDNTEFFNDYISLIARAYSKKTPKLNHEIIKNILSTTLISIGILYKEYSWNTHIANRSEIICKELQKYIIQHYTYERHVSFYAEKLGISLQHLCMVVKQQMGKNVTDIIAGVVIMDAKAKLKSTDMSITEISRSLNFANASFFGKYFKRHVGIGPQEYRNS